MSKTRTALWFLILAGVAIASLVFRETLTTEPTEPRPTSNAGSTEKAQKWKDAFGRSAAFWRDLELPILDARPPLDSVTPFWSEAGIQYLLRRVQHDNGEESVIAALILAYSYAVLSEHGTPSASDLLVNIESTDFFRRAKALCSNEQHRLARTLRAFLKKCRRPPPKQEDASTREEDEKTTGGKEQQKDMTKQAENRADARAKAVERFKKRIQEAEPSHRTAPSQRKRTAQNDTTEREDQKQPSPDAEPKDVGKEKASEAPGAEE